MVGTKGGGDLLLLVAAYLLASVPLYALAGFAKDARGTEAMLKYYLMGALTGVLMLVGVTAADSLKETLKGQRWLALGCALGFAVLLIAGIGNASLSTFNGLGAANALVVDAVSFGVCALVFGWATLAMRAERVDERPAGTTYVEELREGWTFLRKDAVLVAMSGMVAVTNLLDLAFSAVLLPVWIKESGYSVGVMGAYFATWAAASAASDRAGMGVRRGADAASGSAFGFAWGGPSEPAKAEPMPFRAEVSSLGTIQSLLDALSAIFGRVCRYW